MVRMLPRHHRFSSQWKTFKAPRGHFSHLSLILHLSFLPYPSSLSPLHLSFLNLSFFPSSFLCHSPSSSRLPPFPDSLLLPSIPPPFHLHPFFLSSTFFPFPALPPPSLLLPSFILQCFHNRSHSQRPEASGCSRMEATRGNFSHVNAPQIFVLKTHQVFAATPH